MALQLLVVVVWVAEIVVSWLAEVDLKVHLKILASALPSHLQVCLKLLLSGLSSDAWQ